MADLGLCTTCKQRGHDCKAVTLGDNDQPVCIWCADGVPCAFDQEQKRRGRLTPNLPSAADLDAAAEEENIRQKTATAPKTKSSGGEMNKQNAAAEHECGFEGCTNLTNKEHCKKCASKIYYREHYSKAAKHPNGIHTCSSCSAKLRADNKSGVCTACQKAGKSPSTTAKPSKAKKATKAKPAKSAAKANGNHIAVASAVLTEAMETATICVTEERLNHFLLSLPIAMKAEIASEYLGRN